MSATVVEAPAPPDNPTLDGPARLRKVASGRRHPFDRLLDLQIAACILAAGYFTVGWGGDVAAMWVSDIVYPLVLALACHAGFRALKYVDADSRPAWRLIWIGICLTLLGEAAWSVIEIGLGQEVAFPGLPDLFYLAFYPVVTIGILRLPHLSGSRFTNLRVSLDALIGTAAFGTLVWEWYASDVFVDGAVPIEQAVNLAYPLLDVFVMAAIITAILRRSPYRLDRRLVWLLVALGFIVAADIALPALEATTGYAAGSALDGIWLLGYAGYGMVARHMRRPLARRESAVVRPRLWKLLLPYAWVVAVFGLFFWRIFDLEVEVLESVAWSALFITVGVIIRQAVSIREAREFVEAERDQLIASVSHELRTPLTAVAGFSEVIASDWETLPDDEKREMAAIIRTQSGHLAQSVGDMVSLVRDRLNRVSLDREAVDAKNLVADAIRVVFDVTAGPLPVKARIEPLLGFYGDRLRLIQMVSAMLANAHRYGGGSIEVIARRKGQHRILEVHDDGPGIPVRYEELVWERFERGDHRLSSAIPGSGLGLAIVRALAEAHGGSAGYRRSEILGGACFWIDLSFD